MIGERAKLTHKLHIQWLSLQQMPACNHMRSGRKPGPEWGMNPHVHTTITLMIPDRKLVHWIFFLTFGHKMWENSWDLS